MSGREIPSAKFYGDFLQLENGVGLWALLKSEAENALADTDIKTEERHISIATGVSAFRLYAKLPTNVSKNVMGLNAMFML